jgi:hypothetical protein
MTTGLEAAAGAPVQRPDRPVQLFKDGRWIEAPRSQVKPWLVQVLTVTPEWAAKVLELRNTENRDEKPAYQEKLIHALRTDRWYLTNQGIGFFENGQLADGQNRLASIVRSGVPAEIVVVFGIDPDAKAAIDDGVKRSDLDIARLSGDRATPRRAIMIANTLISMMRNGINYPDKYEKQDFYRKYMDGLMFTHNLFVPVKRRGITQISVLAAVCRAFYHFKDTEERLERLRHFVKVLNDGLGDQHRDRAAIKLRNMLLDETTGQSKSRMNTGYAREEVYRKTEKAIQHFMREEAIEKLYEAREELFPLPGENEFFGRLVVESDGLDAVADDGDGIAGRITVS